MPPNREVNYIGYEPSRESLLSPHEKEREDTESDVEGQQGRCGLCEGLRKWWNGVCIACSNMLQFAKSDPRKAIFSVKMGMALGLVSLLMFMEEPYKQISTYSIWAILTVVVVFEYTVGATLSKGFNRGLGTFTAGGLAFGVAELAMCAEKWEPMIFIASIFIAGALATFAKLYPRMKPYEYGFRVFLITFCFILVSGYRTRTFIHTAITRFLLIVLGASVAFFINGCIYPIWAGEDLHKLIVKNFMGVANSLEGCIDGYLSGVEMERVPSTILVCQADDDPVYNAYRAALFSASQEETLEGFASWEWPHGKYTMMKYPWKDYVKLGGALRHCTYMVMALHGCILSEIQAPRDLRQVFSNELRQVSDKGAKVLRALGNNLDKMIKLDSVDMLEEVHKAAEELQAKIDARSYLLVNSESWVIGNRVPTSPCQSDEGRDQVGNLSHQMSPSQQGVNVLSRSWHCHESNLGISVPVEKKLCKQLSWPSPHSIDIDYPYVGTREKTLESASVLSLATFASLLIEFVARLDNLVDSFNELSLKAKFKDPDACPSNEIKGIWRRLLRIFRLW